MKSDLIPVLLSLGLLLSIISLSSRSSSIIDIFLRFCERALGTWASCIGKILSYGAIPATIYLFFFNPGALNHLFPPSYHKWVYLALFLLSLSALSELMKKILGNGFSIWSWVSIVTLSSLLYASQVDPTFFKTKSSNVIPSLHQVKSNQSSNNRIKLGKTPRDSVVFSDFTKEAVHTLSVSRLDKYKVPPKEESSIFEDVSTYLSKNFTPSSEFSLFHNVSMPQESRSYLPEDSFYPKPAGRINAIDLSSKKEWKLSNFISPEKLKLLLSHLKN